MASLTFTERKELSEYEWDPRKKDWNRPGLDRAVLQELSKPSNGYSFFRLGLLLAFLIASAWATVVISRVSIAAAIPFLYIYYFFFGFWVAVAHELQHRIVFSRSLGWFSELVFYPVQFLIWNSPRYARVSHRLHHRYTMVQGADPETAWPEVITSRWLRRYLWSLILKILVVGAVADLVRAVREQVLRAAGVEDRMMRDHCTEEDLRVIRIESLAILLFHTAVVAVSILFRRWEPFLLLTLAWHIGSGMESLWHQTEHIGRLYNVKDQRLCTRSVRVSSFLGLLYWGLDDHVDHHLFPAVPSAGLPELHRILKEDLAEPKTMVQCWREMFAIARQKDRHPEHEYVPVDLQTGPLS